MARVLHVHADLVSAPGEQLALDEAVAVVLGASFKALEHAEGGDGLPGARRIAHSHAAALVGRTCDGRVDHAGVMGHDAVHERDVVAVDRPILNLRHELASGLVGLGRQHEPARVAVEPVHDAEPVGLLPLHVAQVLLAAVPDKGIDQRAMGVIDGRVADEPDLLREHEHVLVLEADIQIDRLAVDHHGLRLVVHLVDDGVPRRHGMLFGNRGAVHENAALLDGARGGRAGSVEPPGGAQGIQAVSCVLGGGDMAKRA